MAIADELTAILKYETEGEGEIKKFNNNLDETEKRQKARASRLKKLKIGAAITGVTVAATKSFKSFAEFERAVNRIGITAGASVNETANAQKQLGSLAESVSLPLNDAVTALDTLVASGLSLKEALSFMPTVLQTAQASGASVQDIANSLLKSSSAFSIASREAGLSADIMAAGGKAGQFELKEMAAFIPTLSNLYASLGNEGNEGLGELVALLQTMREKTGSSAEAATQLRNVLVKINSAEMAKRFGEAGVNLTGKLKEAKDNGEDVLQTFIKLTNQVTQGDASKLPVLFRDQELLLGMQTLTKATDRYKEFLDEVSGDVEGTVFHDLNRILGDTQAKIDDISTKTSRLTNTLGAIVAENVSPVIDNVADGYEKIREGTSSYHQIINHSNAVAARPGMIEAFANRVEEWWSREAPKSHEENLADLSALSNPVINDSRADNRQFPLTSNVTVNQTVTNATDAPRSAAQATGNAVAGEVVKQRTQAESEPSF